MAFGYYSSNLVLGAFLGATNITAPTTVYLALYATNPTASDTGTEVSTSGTAYARTIITFGTPSAGVATNSGAVIFARATSNWGTVSYGAIRDASTGGNLLFFGPLTIATTVSSGDLLTFPIGSITCTLT